METLAHSSMNSSVLEDTSPGEPDSPTTVAFMEEVETYMTYKVADFFAVYYIPVLVPIGLIGNTLSFLVMIKPNNRKMSTCIYMAGIGINDNCMMIWGLGLWLTTALDIYTLSSLECKILASLIALSRQISTYQVLAMTVDKYIAIKWPHKAATYSTPRRAKIIGVVIVLGGLVYHIPHFILTNMVGKVCVGYADGGLLGKVFTWVSFVVDAVIPISSLIYMNFVILKTVRGSRQMFSSQGQGQNSKREENMKNTEHQLTIMMLLVATLFLILLTPAYMRYIYSAFAPRDTPDKYALLMLFYHLSRMLYTTNNGINFFLYCISGQKFRNDLMEILGCKNDAKRSGKDSTQSSVTDTTNV